MSSIPPGVILVWPGTHAGIPSGYARETTLDTKFTKGAPAGNNPNVTGGSPTHSHTSPAHSHSMNNHTHSYTVPTVNSNAQTGGGDGDNLREHYHTGTTGAASGGGLSSVAATYASVSNNPPYHEVIFIKSEGGPLPNNVIALFGSSSIPSGWQFCNGLSGSPDLRDKYLRGAGTGADAGATGGSTTNIHTLIHTHTVASHSHGSSTSGAAITSNDELSTSPPEDSVHKGHTHSVTIDAMTDTISSTDPVLTTTETVEPEFKKLLAVQNQTGGASKPKGIIGLWLDALSAIPAGWLLCDGNNGTPDMKDKFLKCANLTTEAGVIGGSNTHTHAAQTHTHAAAGSHTHTASASAHNTGALTKQTAGSPNLALNKNTNHSGFSTDPTTTIYSSDSTTADSANNEPEYRTVAYIQFDKELGGSFLFNIL